VLVQPSVLAWTFGFPRSRAALTGATRPGIVSHVSALHMMGVVFGKAAAVALYRLAFASDDCSSDTWLT